MSRIIDAAPDTRHRILGATALALGVAAVVLVAFVLPAEFGKDPLGTGRMTGLVALSQSVQEALGDAPASYLPDAVSFDLAPFESVEYKYRLEDGAALVFSWSSTGDVVAELHAEPDDAPEGFAESFDKRRASGAHGSYHAPFSGWHGWFWENRGMKPVRVTLQAAGFFSAVRIYGGGRVREEVRTSAVTTPAAAGDSR